MIWGYHYFRKHPYMIFICFRFSSFCRVGYAVAQMEYRMIHFLLKGRNPPKHAKATLDYPVHPGRLTWNLQITHLERKMIFQASMIVFHVNLPGCTCSWASFFVYRCPADRYGIMKLYSLNRFGDGCSVIGSYYFHPKLAIDVWYSLYISSNI